MAQTAQNNTARAASKARREAMSSRGKAALNDTDRTRGAPAQQTATQAAPAKPADAEAGKSRGDCGCKGEKARSEAETATTPHTDTASKLKVTSRARVQQPHIKMNSSRAASLARRQAMSQRGKAGLNGNGMSEAQTARAANPKLSGRELAKKVRADRCRNGNTGKKKSEPVGRMRPGKDYTSSETGAATDAPWKVGQSLTGHGQTLTGTLVGRSSRVTGNEPGTCKNVTGVEYIGADQTEAFCSTSSGGAPSKITSSQTRQGQSVSGNNVGRSSNVTGDETGAGRELTGSQYMQKGNGKSPMKVGTSQTLRGGSLTGTQVGRSERVTGDEPGTCKSVTGDDYVGQEQYQGFCGKAPKPQDQKVGFTQTFHGRSVSGTLTGRSTRMTGDEPGTCKSVTGTPYAGLEQYSNYCKPEETSLASARYRQQRSTPGSVMTGIQPGLNGHLTGADKGLCEPVSGTPYVGADQYAEACPSVPAEPGSPDFPQQLGETPWGKFSVQSPVHASQGDEHFDVTGNRYEQGKITGPFGMAGGKVTGTEEARFGKGHNAEPAPAPMPETAQQVQGRVKSRISGEGIEAGLKITGDDWDRGDRVTGTEGMTATKRNPTRQGGRATSAMQMKPEPKRNEDIPEPISPVTGGSGNTEKGSFITYSGGARG
ncbi:CsoS2 family carboxysome shell protein [Thiohalophilus sp.]|uniref:CsoS2 family carboxysome shell protein n=1 Tax=Thiohalophilus sp. TaxID=3028392 RepID=UPI002ACDE962|nr:CsoS2 family carboxysome shell protein [Thiohalophilus sp.]MDZ7661690.1 CsoS2 family carboxysome shell protein [Thiohalophilus sp.]